VLNKKRKEVKMEKLIEYKGIKYIVSTDGKVFSTSNKGRGKYHKEIKQRLNNDGYLCVTVGDSKNRTRERVHRLVALAFIENPNNLPEVDHIDNDKTNNNITNLQWISSFDNKSKIPYQTRSECRRNERNGMATFTVQEIKDIRERYERNNEPVYRIAKSLNRSWSTISHICNYETWKDI
jgi:hypothetical protein